MALRDAREVAGDHSLALVVGSGGAHGALGQCVECVDPRHVLWFKDAVGQGPLGASWFQVWRSARLVLVPAHVSIPSAPYHW